MITAEASGGLASTDLTGRVLQRIYMTRRTDGEQRTANAGRTSRKLGGPRLAKKAAGRNSHRGKSGA